MKTLKDVRWDHTVCVHTIKPTIIPKDSFLLKIKNGLMVLAKHFTTLRRLKNKSKVSQILLYMCY